MNPGKVSRLLQSIVTAGDNGQVTLDDVRQFVADTQGIPGDTRVLAREDGGRQEWKSPTFIRVTHTIKDE